MEHLSSDMEQQNQKDNLRMTLEGALNNEIIVK